MLPKEKRSLYNGSWVLSYSRPDTAIPRQQTGAAATRHGARIELMEAIYVTAEMRARQVYARSALATQ
jgi:hypothetical protein